MFFVLLPAEVSKDQVYGVMGSSGKTPWVITRCPICKRMLSMEQINDLPFELYGLYVKDFVWTDDDVLVTETFADKLKTSGLKGFAFRQADIVDWQQYDPTEEIVSSQKQIMPRLWQLSVTGKGGSILKLNSATKVSQCPACETTVYKLQGKGLKVDKNDWDGADIFVTNEFPGIILITDKFSSWLKTNQVENYSVLPADKFDLSDLGDCISREKTN